MFLVAVDAYSKWMDVQVVSISTSRNTIDHVWTVFATHGLPEILVSDNAWCSFYKCRVYRIHEELLPTILHRMAWLKEL